jgi:hypothetical protein
MKNLKLNQMSFLNLKTNRVKRRTSAVEIPHFIIQVSIAKRPTEAGKRQYCQNNEESDHELIQPLFNARHFVSLELGVHHHFRVFARVHDTAVDLGRDLQTAPSQKYVVVNNKPKKHKRFLNIDI